MVATNAETRRPERKAARGADDLGRKLKKLREEFEERQKALAHKSKRRGR